MRSILTWLWVHGDGMVSRIHSSNRPSGPTDGRGASRIARLAPVGAERYLWYLVFLSLALDIGLTYYGISQGLSEANPIVRAAIERFGTVAALVSLKGFSLAVGVAGWAILPTKYRVVVPLGIALPWVVASLANLSLLASTVWF